MTSSCGSAIRKFVLYRYEIGLTVGWIELELMPQGPLPAGGSPGKQGG
jgi:hypothetical protein